MPAPHEPGPVPPGLRRARARRALRIAALVLLLVYGAAALALLLTPDGWFVNRANIVAWLAVTEPLGLQRVISPDLFQAVANIVLFVPAFAALAVLVPTWWWVAAGALLSTGVETYQLIIGSRQASVADVVMNTLGALIGTALGLRLSARRARSRDRDHAADGAGPGPDAPTTRP